MRVTFFFALLAMAGCSQTHDSTMRDGFAPTSQAVPPSVDEPRAWFTA